MSIAIKLDESLHAQLDKFDKELQGRILGNAVSAGAQVLYHELHQRVPVAEGILKRSLYYYFNRDDMYSPVKSYFVGVNMAVAPHWHLVEYGHIQTHVAVQLASGEWVTLKDKPLSEPRFVPAQPYLRPTYDAKIGQALEAVKTSLKQQIETRP